MVSVLQAKPQHKIHKRIPWHNNLYIKHVEINSVEVSKSYRESLFFLINAMPRTNSSCRLYCIFTASSLLTKLSVPLLEQVNLHFPGELVLLPPDSFLPSLGDVPSFINKQAMFTQRLL